MPRSGGQSDPSCPDVETALETRITNYTIASVVYTKSAESAVYEKELENKVNALIQHGWQPFGGLQLVRRESVLVALQPMVRTGANSLEVVHATMAEAR